MKSKRCSVRWPFDGVSRCCLSPRHKIDHEAEVVAEGRRVRWPVTDRREVGRGSKAKGEDFESWVEDGLNEALRLGIITHWIHNGPTAKMLHGRWEMVKAGVSDYLAVQHNKVATTIAIEAKSYRNRLPRNEISTEQQRHLNAVVLGGGLAFLLVRIVEETEAAEFESTYIVPWQRVPWVTLKSAESVSPKELASWIIPPDRKCYLEPFCPVRGVPVSGAGQRRVFPRE